MGDIDKNKLLSQLPDLIVLGSGFQILQDCFIYLR